MPPTPILPGALALSRFVRSQLYGIEPSDPVTLVAAAPTLAAVGLFAGTIFLGEHYQLLTWAGAVIITAGVFITTKAQSQTSPKAQSQPA